MIRKQLQGRSYFNKGTGVVMIASKDHPKATLQGYVPEYILIAEKALGHFLLGKAQVHHIDGDRKNSAPNNLVICQDSAYHALLHARARALRACGNPNWRRCAFCETYDDIKNLPCQNKHRHCWNDYVRKIARANYRGPGHAKGEDQGSSKLTEEKVKYIRSSKKSCGILANELGLKSASTVAAVRRGLTWRHVQ